MSVCVTIRTEKKLRPNVYLKHLAENGEHIVVTSDEYPSVKFGTHQKAIRGIEVIRKIMGLKCVFAHSLQRQIINCLPRLSMP